MLFLISKFGLGVILVILKLPKNRNSKLGDYRKLPDKSHQITVNGTLEPQLFFFVLTHELAHLIAFENMAGEFRLMVQNGSRLFREMLLESLTVYAEDLRPIIQKFSKSPKVNLWFPDLVKYFHVPEEDELLYQKTLSLGMFCP